MSLPAANNGIRRCATLIIVAGGIVGLGIYGLLCAIDNVRESAERSR